MKKKSKFRQPPLQKWVLRVCGGIIAFGTTTGIPLQRWATKLSTVVRLPGYLRRLGAANGFRTWLAFLFGKKTIGVEVPRYEQPIIVRCGTPDCAVFERIFIADEYKAALQVRNCANIIDCGAYAGYSSLYFAKHFPNARIVAVEPDAENMEMLKTNTEHCGNVIPVRAAVWSRRCPMRIRNHEAPAWSFAMEETPADDEGAIAGVTVEELMKEHGLGHLDLMKIDIEGGEREVFRSGAESWLAATGMLIIELHDYLYPNSSENFFKAVEGLPFEMKASGENLILVNPMRAPA